MRVALVLLVGALLPGLAWSGTGEAQLRRFLESTQSLDAAFVQTRVDGAGPERAAGRLRLQRPGRFRWDYVTPYRQLILADGQRLWILDPDLEQASVRPQAAALGNSPARLLSGELDVASNFDIHDLGPSAGLDWVELRPAGVDEEFASLALGFADGELRSMRMLDNLGQETLIEFNDINTNINLDTEVFTFVLPAGVDLLGE